MTQPKKKAFGDPRRSAASVIRLVLKNKAFSNIALSKEMTASNLKPIDRSLCTELCYGTLRWLDPLKASLQRALDKPSQKIDNHILPHLLVAAYQLQFLSEKIPPHAAVNSAVNNIKREKRYLAGFANLILRRIGSSTLETRQKKELTKSEEISQVFGHPEIIARAITELLPKQQWFDAAFSFNDRPKVWLHVLNDNHSLAKGLKHPFVPKTVSLEQAGALSSLEGFDSGDFFVQDPASQIAAYLTAPKTNDFVIDGCASPGSKSMLIKSLNKELSNLLAIDTNERKIQRIQENSARLNLDIQTRIGKLQEVALDPKLEEKADILLLDAPCSGTGTIRRHPEIKFNLTQEKLDTLLKLQAELLDASTKLIKSGGALIYSVCSFLPEEGSKQVESFLERNPDFVRVDPLKVLPWLPKTCINKKHEVNLWPHLHDCDAFFAVKLKKK